MATTPLTPVPPAKAGAAKKAAVKKAAPKKKVAAVPVPAPKKKDWAAFAAAIALCVTAIIMSQNDKDVSMAQIASAGKGPIPAIPAKGGNNIPDWKQQPHNNPAATSPPPVQSAQENLRTFVFTDTDGEKFWWPPGETVRLCAGPVGKTVVPTPDTYLEGGEVREEGRRWINPGECVISKRRNS